MTRIEKAIEDVRNRKDRSAWDRGVSEYAVELLEAERVMLNGASDWLQYSEGACSLVYDEDIAERLCTPSVLKRKRGGELPPSSTETWLDVQARALKQASRRAVRALKWA